MTVAADVLLGLAVLAALIDWWGVAADRLSVEFVAKPLVDIALIGTALAIDTTDDVGRGLVVAALGAALVGDVVRSTPDARFESGLFATIVAHLLFTAALADSLQPATGTVAALLLVGIGIGAVPQIVAAARAVSSPTGLLVAAYLFTAGALGVFASGTEVLIAAIGGALLVTSAALLTWNRFVSPAPGGSVLVHVTDHMGQVGLVLWLAT